ncbi:MAG: hypothetical protein QM757_26545 [Paludibaculum sp.]
MNLKQQETAKEVARLLRRANRQPAVITGMVPGGYLVTVERLKAPPLTLFGVRYEGIILRDPDGLIPDQYVYAQEEESCG